MVSSSKMCAAAHRNNQLTALVAGVARSANAYLLLDSGERVRHLGPYRLHGKGGINSDEYSPGIACEVYVVDTAQHPIQPEEHHTPEQKLFHRGLRYISAFSN